MSVLRNRLLDGKNTFCAFIDLPKAFDWVDHDMLFYKLVKYNITGKIYRCIKALYNNAIACVNVNNYVTQINLHLAVGHNKETPSPTLFGYL